MGLPYLRHQSRAEERPQDRPGVARHGVVARPLFDRDLRHLEGSWWGIETALHADRHSAPALQRSLSRLDRGVLDADEGSPRARTDQRQDTCPGENLQNRADQDEALSEKGVERGLGAATYNPTFRGLSRSRHGLTTRRK